MGATYLDRAKIEAAYVVFSTVFDMKLKATPTVYERICTIIPGVSERVEFKWFGSSPTMKRWVGDRAIQRLRGEGQALTTEWWANGIEADQDDLKSDSKLGMLIKRIGMLGSAAPKRLDERVVSFYVFGFAATEGTTYDLQFLFDTDHTASGSGGTAQSNLLTGAFSGTTFNQGLQRAMEFKDDVGEPIGVNPRIVMAGPPNQLLLRQVLKKELISGGETNENSGMAEPLVTPRITGTHWFMLSEEDIMAVILGIEVPPQFASQDDPSSPEAFMRRNFLYGAHTKFGLCYGFWQAAMGSTG